MTVDWDGRIRMDPSSPYAMARLVDLRVASTLRSATTPTPTATDRDAERRADEPEPLPGGCGQLPLRRRPRLARRRRGRQDARLERDDRSRRRRLGRRLFEVPVGFKWFVDGLLDGSVGFGGEESAGASFLRRDGTVWTTDKDGILACLLTAELTARTGRDPGAAYAELTARFGAPAYRRIDARATPAEEGGARPARAGRGARRHPRRRADQRDPHDGARQRRPDRRAEGHDRSGWFAARPSGTEDVYKVYAESFRGEDHLAQLIDEAQQLVSDALARAGS